MAKQWSSVLCLICAHFNFNNYGTCAAFPEGIPYVIASNEIDHFTTLDGQLNDLVYTPVEEKKEIK